MTLNQNNQNGVETTVPVKSEYVQDAVEPENGNGALSKLSAKAVPEENPSAGDRVARLMMGGGFPRFIAESGMDQIPHLILIEELSQSEEVGDLPDRTLGDRFVKRIIAEESKKKGEAKQKLHSLVHEIEALVGSSKDRACWQKWVETKSHKLLRRALDEFKLCSTVNHAGVQNPAAYLVAIVKRLEAGIECAAEGQIEAANDPREQAYPLGWKLPSRDGLMAAWRGQLAYKSELMVMDGISKMLGGEYDVPGLWDNFESDMLRRSRGDGQVAWDRFMHMCAGQVIHHAREIGCS
ncbi:hypothetical protein ACFL2Q_06095 [Thermodesulfobacteriota bacterium]